MWDGDLDMLLHETGIWSYAYRQVNVIKGVTLSEFLRFAKLFSVAIKNLLGSDS